MAGSRADLAARASARYHGGMLPALIRLALRPGGVGIDISDLAVTAVELERRGGGTTARRWDAFAIPTGTIVNGEIRDEAELARVLLAGLRSWRAGKGSCVVALPEEQGFVSTLELPPGLRPEDIGQAVRWEAEGVLPRPLDELSYDYGFIPHCGAPDHRDALLIAFPRSIVESYRRVLAQAGFARPEFEPASQAVARALAFGPEPLAIADIGRTRTSLAVVGAGSLRFATSIPLGGRNLEVAISRGLDITPETARAVKTEFGLDPDRRDGRVAELIRPLLAPLVTKLNGLRSAHGVTAVRLSGGEARLFGLEKHLATAVKVPVRLADPFANVALAPGAVPPIPRGEALGYTAAIGLALRALAL